MNKRLFVSTNYDSLFETDNRDDIETLVEFENHSICHWNSSTSHIEEGYGDETTDLFFIHDNLLELSTTINRETDFLLAHQERTNASIKDKFKNLNVKEGHHGTLDHNDVCFRYYAIVLETLLNGKDEAGREIEAGQEAEAIINRIWPDLKARNELDSIVKQRIKNHPNYDENSIIQHSKHINTYVCKHYPETTKNTQP